MTKTFKELIVWQEAMNLVEEIYIHTRTFPKEEIYGLTNQIRRAAVSVASNIAEGNGRRRNRKDYIHFLTISNGSLSEVETQLLIAERLKFITTEVSEKIQEKIQSVGYLLFKLRESQIEGLRK